MFKKIVSTISILIATISAIVVAAVPETANWWDLARPWTILFFSSVLFTMIVVNSELIRRYTYPSFICVLAWAYSHKLIKDDFAKHSYTIYVKNHKSYAKLFEVTQYLYDRVMVAEV